MSKSNEGKIQILRKKIVATKAREVDDIILPIAKQVSSEIDCKSCANCCKILEAGIAPEEIEILARHKEQKAEEFVRDEIDIEEKTGIQYLKKKPCVFLSVNLCSIYQYRPGACRDFPGLERPLLKYRIRKILALYGLCPIVYHTIEKAFSYFHSENPGSL